MDQLLPWLRLQLTPGLGRVGLIRLIEHFQTPENALAAADCGWPRLPGLRQGLNAMVPSTTDTRVQDACQRLERLGGGCFPSGTLITRQNCVTSPIRPPCCMAAAGCPKDRPWRSSGPVNRPALAGLSLNSLQEKSPKPASLLSAGWRAGAILPLIVAHSMLEVRPWQFTAAA